MAVIFAVVGGGAIVILSDPYSDHSDHNDYDNYSNYSDAAERRKRRQAEKQSEINSKQSEINTYKSDSVNPYLSNQSLINQSGVTVPVKEVKEDGEQKINLEQNADIKKESAGLNIEVAEIDNIINKIDKILEEK